MRVIEGKLDREIRKLAFQRAPLEAVGLILSDDRIIELPNRAERPEELFVASRNDIIEAIEHERNIHLEEVVLFHSHPGGGVGPSRLDMRNKTPFRYHLVVTIIDNDVVYTWY